MRRPGAILPLVLPALLAACAAERRDPARLGTPDPVPVTLAPVRRAPAERTAPITGSLYGVAEVTLAAQVTARVQAIAADLGDRVLPGSIVVELDPTEYELTRRQREAALAESLAHLGLAQPPRGEFDTGRVPAVERAKRLLAQAEARLARGREYSRLETPLISGESLDDLQTAVEVARSDVEREQLLAQARLAEVRTREAELRVAEHRIAECTIRAPLHASAEEGGAFEVAARFVEVGELVEPGAPLFRLVARDQVVLRAALPERLLGRVGPGARVTIATDADPGPFLGAIDRIAPAVDETTRTFRVEARLPNPDGRLRPGAFARGTVTIGRDADVAWIPAAALVQFAGVEKVFTVRDGVAVQHLVSSGMQADGQVEVHGPLDGVTEVVADGAARLADGVPVILR